MIKGLAIAAAMMTAMAASGADASSFTGPKMSFPAASTSVPRTSNIDIPNFSVTPTRIWIDVNINHVDVNDLTFVLKHNGVAVTMMTQKCSSDANNSDIGILRFIDTATYVPSSAGNCVTGGATREIKPEKPLSAFYSTSAAGTWTLQVSDYIVNSPGTINSWTLNIEYAGGQQYSYGWKDGTWSAFSTMCGEATRTRTPYCERDDGTRVDEAYCTGTKPATSETSTQTASCEKRWFVFSDTVPDSCGPATGTRVLHCHLHQADGSTVTPNHEADLALCDQGTKPAASYATNNYAACGYTWSYGAWTDWSTTCGSATRTRTKTCTRSDGTDVTATGSANCGTASATTQTQVNVSTCTYAWNEGAWSTTPACGPTDESRPVSCRRSDGVTVEDASCPATKPDTNRAAADGATSYSACTFAWKASAWTPIPDGTCGYTTRTRSISCTRSDGTPAGDASCKATRPATSTNTLSYAGCGYEWKQSGYTLGRCDNAQQTYTATYSCRRSNGAWVSASYCGGDQPKRTETRECPYWQAHANDAYPDAQAGDVRPATAYATTGVTSGTSQSPVRTVAATTEGKPGANTGGTYNPSTGSYTTPTGQVLTDGYWDALTNTYWDSPEYYQQWKAKAEDVIIMRRVIAPSKKQ